MHPFESLVVREDAVGIHWFGQSTFGLKNAQGTIVQVDPYYPHERPTDRFIHARPPLHEASLHTDFVLLTHDHGDHTCTESIARIAAAYPAVQIVGPAESIQRIRDAGITVTATTIAASDAAKLGTMTAHAVYAKPPEGLPSDDIAPPDVTHLGYVVETGGVRVYISGDPVNTFAEHDALTRAHPRPRARHRATDQSSQRRRIPLLCRLGQDGLGARPQGRRAGPLRLLCRP